MSAETQMENIEEYVSIPSEDALRSPIISKKRKRLSVSPIIRSARQSIKQKRLDRSPTIDEIFSQSSCEGIALSSVPSTSSTFQPRSLFVSQESKSSQNTNILTIEENHSDEDVSDTTECLDITVRRIPIVQLLIAELDRLLFAARM